MGAAIGGEQKFVKINTKGLQSKNQFDILPPIYLHMPQT